VNNLISLGVPFGSEEFVLQQLAERAEVIGTYCDKLVAFLTLGLRLLTYLTSSQLQLAKSSYHMRLLPPSLTKQEAAACSVHLRRTMRALLGPGEGIGSGIGASSSQRWMTRSL
jgi:hypothetical protein